MILGHGRRGEPDMRWISSLVAGLVLLGVIAGSTAPAKKAPIPDLEQLEKMAARFAPTQIRVDTSKLSSGDQQALVKLIEAARILNQVFLRQRWSGNLELYARLEKDTTALGKARRDYFWLNKGPWSEIDEYQ